MKISTKDINNMKKKLSSPIGSWIVNESRNVYVSRNISLSLDTLESGRNLNQVVLGGSRDSSLEFIRENLERMNTSYVVSDPEGVLYDEYKTRLEDNGYEVKLFSLTGDGISYNPLKYIKDDKSLASVVNTLVSAEDPIWEKTEKAYLSAIILHILETKPEESRNMTKVLEEIGSYDLNYPEDSRASEYSKIFMLAPLKTREAIVKDVFTNVLSVFRSPAIQGKTTKDELNLYRFGASKEGLNSLKAIFVKYADAELNKVASLLFTQLFDIIFEQRAKGNFNDHVRFYVNMTDGISLNGSIYLEPALAISRSHDYSVVFFTEDTHSLDKFALSNCDTKVFITMDDKNKQWLTDLVSRFTSPSIIPGSIIKPLFSITDDELYKIEDGQCLVVIRGFKPVTDNR